VAFGVFYRCFAYRLSFCFVVPPFLDVQNQLVVFYSTLVGVFKRLLGLGSLECPKAPFVHQYVVLPIYNDGIRLISLEVIVPIAYLGSWALIALVITFKFLLDFCPFLLEPISVNSSGPSLSKRIWNQCKSFFPQRL
jgi:hypothetical protein